MKSFMPKLLFYYAAIASFFVLASTVFTSSSIGPFVFAILFLPVAGYFIIEFFKQIRSQSDLGSPPTKTEIAIILLIFILLLGVGIKNIIDSSGDIQFAESVQTPPPSPSQLIFKSQETKPKKMVTIKITDDSTLINIRQKPTIYSDKLAEAKDGDTFEYISNALGWYEIKFQDGSTGFISGKYIKEAQK